MNSQQYSCSAAILHEKGGKFFIFDKFLIARVANSKAFQFIDGSPVKSRQEKVFKAKVQEFQTLE